MKKLLAGFAALLFLAGVAMAEQPTPLSDAQMDNVTAGFNFWTNTAGTVFVFQFNPPNPPLPPPGVLVANFPSLGGGNATTNFASVTVGPVFVTPSQ
jgi:hypothetical protein